MLLWQVSVYSISWAPWVLFSSNTFAFAYILSKEFLKTFANIAGSICLSSELCFWSICETYSKFVSCFCQNSKATWISSSNHPCCVCMTQICSIVSKLVGPTEQVWLLKKDLGVSGFYTYLVGVWGTFVIASSSHRSVFGLGNGSRKSFRNQFLCQYHCSIDVHSTDR